MSYGELLPSKPVFIELIGKGVPTWQSRAARLARPLVTRVIARGLKITPDGVARSRVVVDETFARVGARVADGRPYLCGDRFTAADLTFASLAAPVLMPDAYARHFGATLPASFLALRDALRATPAGAFAMNLYARDRAARPTR